MLHGVPYGRNAQGILGEIEQIMRLLKKAADIVVMRWIGLSTDSRLGIVRLQFTLSSKTFLSLPAFPRICVFPIRLA